MTASYGVLLFEAAAARLSLATEDYAKGPRLVALFQWVLSLGIGAVACAFLGKGEGIVAFLSMYVAVHLGFIGMFLASDADGLARCHRPHTRRFSLLRPGALRGYRLMLLLVAGHFLGTWALASATHPLDERLSCTVVAAPAYALLYMSLPLLIARGSRSRALRSPLGTRLLTLVLVVVGCGLPPLLAVLCGAGGDHPKFNFLNPLIELISLRGNSDHPLRHASGLLLLWGVALGVGVLTDQVLAARDKQAA
jgi:hypothetical protein